MTASKINRSSIYLILLSKSSNPIPGNLASAIKALDQDRLELQADDSLDLDGRQQVLRKLENRLEHMTPEQTEYTIKHLPHIYEI